MRAALRWASLLAPLLTLACESPQGPEIPPRPPAPAASPGDCPPPHITDFGNDWYLLADLDRGEACYAYLERDACVLGIFEDCNVASIDPRQWRGAGFVERVPDSSPVRFSKKARLWTEYPASTNGAGGTRRPRCCEGGVTASATASWALMKCGLNSCGTLGDPTHAGLYLERFNPELDPTTAVQPSLQPPTGILSMAYDKTTKTLWLASETEVVAFDPATAAFESQAQLTQGQFIVARDGIAYASEGNRLRILGGTPGPQTVELPGKIVAMQAQPNQVLLGLDTPQGPILQSVDGLTGALTATAALPASPVSMHGDGPTYLALSERSAVFEVQANLSLTTVFDTSLHTEQTETSFTPRAVHPFDEGVAFLGPCHQTSSRIHCVFEARAVDEEPRRLAVAGVQQLQILFEDIEEDRWLTVSANGHITQIQRSSGRPYLAAQVRLTTRVVAAAFVADQRRIYVLADNQLIPVELGLIE